MNTTQPTTGRLIQIDAFGTIYDAFLKELDGKLERYLNLPQPEKDLIYEGWVIAKLATQREQTVDWVPELGEEVLTRGRGVGRVKHIEYMRGWSKPNSIHVTCYADNVTYHFAPENVKPWRR